MKVAWVVLLAGLLASCGEDADPDDGGHRCGDGVNPHVQGTSCDDGNTADGDGCSADCWKESGWNCDDSNPQVADVCTPRCGDNTIVGDEVCDTGLDPYCSFCREVVGSCGDGLLQSHEGCDSGGAPLSVCIDCQPVFGYACSGEPSTCGQSGLPPDLLIASMDLMEATAFCEWNIRVLGGESHTNYCESTDYQTDRQEECVERVALADYGTCTIADWEAHLAMFEDACSYLTGPDPACASQ